ncbi:integrase catalytic domain-containing protein [Pseudarthrobacter sp. S9]|uniref:integrase catalytic domain-containing protein n=1 Tax=Pseudarthrobacter sp. S9 TaxID=3418421 RepID=UPI003D08C2F7
MGQLSMGARREITKKHAAEYGRASKKAKGVMLDQLVATTGWSRANTRRALRTALQRKGPVKAVKRVPRSRSYGYDTLKLLVQVWNLAGRPSGKYLAATMAIWLPKLERFHELDQRRLNEQTRAQLLAVSGATIDRMLKPTKDGARILGLSGTKPGPLLRNSIQVRKAGDEHEQAPGFVEADLVLHCGPTLAGEFIRSLTVTDVFTGWTENIAIKNGAHRWVLEAMTGIEARLPFPLVGLDTDNGGEFINHALIKWAGERDLFFTRARPYKSNDNAHVEQKNGDVVRRHAFHYRYDTAGELRLLNELYPLVRVRLNMFTATTKAIGWRSNRNGRKTRIYDRPRTPYQRVMDSAVLTPERASEFARLFNDTNPAELTRAITAIQHKLIALAKDKTNAITAGISRAEIAEAPEPISRAS